MAEQRLERGEFGAELGALGGIGDGAGEGELVPAGGEGADDLVEDGDGELGELVAAGTVFAEDFAREGEKRVDAREGGRFVAVRGGERLGGDAGEKLDVEFPRGEAVGFGRRELGLEKTEVQFQTGQAPSPQEISAFHISARVGTRRGVTRRERRGARRGVPGVRPSSAAATHARTEI